METNDNNLDPIEDDYGVKPGESKGHLMLGGVIIVLNIIFISALFLYFFYTEFTCLWGTIKNIFLIIILWVLTL